MNFRANTQNESKLGSKLGGLSPGPSQLGGAFGGTRMSKMMIGNDEGMDPGAMQEYVQEKLDKQAKRMNKQYKVMMRNKDIV